ncbi:NAD(P)/FAD-dependent oxidoreductase [Candidatus Solincola tengchongensis]|uniref:phytoene desaturase family protein n=1 Tax=Candidatus Solincola tengchongensis TaxID=2900693 RepID=UPI0025806F70|nr:NAD(P)/FAD-dependent oxidoreductase [Candidatus Solincola tengchongensis]
MADYDVIVIGAGLGGLTAGALLAGKGRRTLVLEQSGSIGGCCSTYEREGYRFDVGATILEIMRPFEILFQRLGTSLWEEVKLEPCDPVYGIIFPDGSRLAYPASVEEKAEVISRISPEDGRAWLEYAHYVGDFMRKAVDSFFLGPVNGMPDMARIFLREPRLLKFLPLFARSFEDVMRRFFKDEKVLDSLSYPGKFCGLPPALAPGIFAFLSYAEHEGVYFPRGGMIALPEAVRRCGERFGMQLLLNARVEKVLVRGRRVEGVRLADGMEMTSTVVVSDVNARTLYLEMVGEEHLPWLPRYGIKSYRLSASAPMINVGLDRRPPLDAHHTLITESMEKMNEYWFGDMRKGLLPRETFGLVCFPTFSDPSMAPEGHHVLNIVQSGPYGVREIDWDRDKRAYGERQLERLSKRAIPGLADHVTVMDVLTPRDYERRLLLPEGAILGLDMDLPSSAVFRPAARSKSIRGLYLCGASTHPGGGLPSVTASGIIAADLVGKYE